MTSILKYLRRREVQLATLLEWHFGADRTAVRFPNASASRGRVRRSRNGRFA